MRPIATFSICAAHPSNGEIGVAVASKFLSVGSVVPWVTAGVGAIATQSWANTAYGPEGLALLARGLEPQAVIDRLTEQDEGRDSRQLGIVAMDGRSATFTGTGCHAWAGGRTGRFYACQGNILTGPEVVDAMVDSFERKLEETSAGVPQDLADMLLAALDSGDKAGGDSRGRQSAALYVARANGGYGGRNDRYIDLRIDDHPDPVAELKRLLKIFRLYFFNPDTQQVIAVDNVLAHELQTLLANAGQPVEPTGSYDEQTRQALTTLSHSENLEERMVEGDRIDVVVLDYLRDRFGTGQARSGGVND